MLCMIPTYDNTHAKIAHTQNKSMYPFGEYVKVLRIRVKPSGKEDIARCTIGYITQRRRDGHRELWICGTDKKIHKYAGKFPQHKHIKIPTLAKLLGLSRDWDIILQAPKKSDHMGSFESYAGKAKPHACTLRHR